MSSPALTNDLVTTNDTASHENTDFSTATSGYGTQTATVTQEYEEMDDRDKDIDSIVATNVHVVCTSPEQEIFDSSKPSALVRKSSDSPGSVQYGTHVKETFSVWLPDVQQEIVVRCDKPIKLEVLLREVQVTIAQDYCRLEYFRDGRQCRLQTQEQLDEYLRLPLKRPQLSVAVSTARH